jgi:phosphoserine aminotransferase
MSAQGQKRTYPADRVYNFSAGPSMMPLEVLDQCSREMKNWNNSGMGVAEMSHRGKEFVQIWNMAESNLRQLLNVPQNFKVLMLQGGASGQFAAVPLNLLANPTASADYITTGQWSEKAVKECKKFTSGANEVASSKASKFTIIPDASTWKMTPGASYFHYCDNETVNGVEFPTIPQVNVPLVGDHSSNFLTRPIDFEKHAVVYAGAQKNAGPAGVTFNMVREDFLGKGLPICPTVMNWKAFVDADGMYNTPPTYAVYMLGLCLEHTKKCGGVQHMQEMRAKTASMVYDTIDSADGFYTCPVDKTCRSRTNIPFVIKGGNEALEKKFLEGAKKHSLYTLNGHRSVGGIRASIYNCMPLEGVETLVNYMKSFADENAD